MTARNPRQAREQRPRPVRAWIGGASRSTRVATAVRSAVAVVTVGQFAVTAEALARVVTGSGDDVPVLVVFVVALALLRAGLSWWAELATTRAEARSRAALRQRLYRALLAAGPAGDRAGSEASRRAVLTEGTQAVAGYFARYLPAGFAAVVTVLAVTAVLAVDAPVVAVIAVLGLAASQLLPALWLALVGGPSYATLDALAHSNRVFVDNVRGLPTAKAFNAVADRREVMADDAERLRLESMRVLRVGLSWKGLSGLLTFVTLAATTLTGIALWRHGAATPRTPLMALLILPVAFTALTRFGGNRHALMDAQKAVAPIESILSAATGPDHVDDGSALTGDIVFGDVTFTHPGRDEPAVDGLSLTLPSGSTTAIVGPSGAGKSTIADLLLRFARPQSGRICIGDQRIEDVSAGALYRSITLVSQDTYLFHGTIRDNLTIAQPGADEQRLRAALAQAGLADLVEDLPNGLDTPIGERGELLSSGQRQRLAIARALLTGAGILVFDEATARLDGHTERAVLDTIAALAGDHTIVMIAHRLSAVRDAERILVLEAGRIVQAGNHTELSADTTGRYAALMRTQVTA